jgi:insecticidal toxin complex protein TccC
VRWKPGDAEPVFGDHFDPHGNQLNRQPGTLPLEWNSRDQLAKVTLLKHSNGLPDDEEIYRYSQGERVYKSSLTHTSTITHRREVRYLPGLEIHDRSDGQQLHVIVLPGARCLHWVSGQPAGIEADQLRYSLDDHLGSCALELDRRAGVISQEFYYAFGGTAWWATRSALEASYKTIRYSGKEMDASGLYYYGARYYAPWLQRWISADPAGDVDGLNLYAFVGNNPLGFIDVTGTSKTAAERLGEIKKFMKNLKSAAKEVDKQNTRFERIFEERDLNRTITKITLFSVLSGTFTAGASVGGGLLGSLLGTATLPVVGTVAGASIGAAAAKVTTGKAMKKLGKILDLEPHITPKANPLSLAEIKKKNNSVFSLRRAQDIYDQYSPNTAQGQQKQIKKLVKGEIKDLTTYGAKEFIQIGKLAEEASDAMDGLSPMKVRRLQEAYTKLGQDLQTDYNQVIENFVTLGTPFVYIKGKVIELSAVKNEIATFRNKLQKAQDTATRYSQRQGWPLN